MAGQFLRAAPGELTDRAAPLEALWGVRAGALQRRLEEAPTADGALGHLMDALQPAAAPGNVQRAIAAMTAVRRMAGLDSIARQANLRRRRCAPRRKLSPGSRSGARAPENTAGGRRAQGAPPAPQLRPHRPAPPCTMNPVFRALAALALLSCTAASGQAPAYSAAGMVNATDFSAGPFAPNSVVTIFGSNLTFSADPASAPSGATLPTQLAGIAVYVDNSAAPLLYASDTQINFLIPSDEISGSVQIQVVRQSWAGPSIAVVLTAAAPCLFSTANQYVLAADWNAAGALVTPGAPAHAGDTVVLYATGLGYTQPNLNPGAVPATAAEIQNPASFSLLLNGSPIDPSLVKYVGLTPGWPGLYQINFIVPPNWTADDPQIQISVANQTSAAGLLLAVRAAGETLTAGNTLNR